MRDFGPPEKVYVELEWYDGPRKGVADIGGVPHRFCSHFDENDDQPLGTFVVFPIDQTMLVWSRSSGTSSFYGTLAMNQARKP